MVEGDLLARMQPHRKFHRDPMPPPPEGLRTGLVLVRDVMTRRVQTIGRRARLREAEAKMRDLGIMHLVVVDAAGRVCGVLSDRDVRSVHAIPGREGDAAHTRVEDVMAHHPITVLAGERVADALAKMRAFKIGSLAVVDELGGAVGILTGYDVVTLALWLLNS